MGAQKTIIPPGYQPELDRMPPKPAASCTGIVVILFALCGLLSGGVLLLLSNSGTPTTQTTGAPTVSPDLVIASFTPKPQTPTLDPWSLTGTALMHATASPTVDYCWWLTPTPTPTPTLIYTPDAWQATGTAIYEATNPPQLPTPTPDAPRVWCNNIPTATITNTPRALDELPTIAATRTPLPVTGGGNFQPPQQPIVIQQPPTPEPPQPTLIVMPTAPAPNTPRPPRPTRTPTATNTPTATITPSPTAIPALFVYQSDCAAGFPSFLVQNAGGGALGVSWTITNAGNVMANGFWDQIPSGLAAIASAPAWAGYGGVFELWINQPWSTPAPPIDGTPAPTPAPPAVFCALPPTLEPPTAIPFPTLPPEITQEPQP